MKLATYKDFEGEEPDSMYNPAYSETPDIKLRRDFIVQYFPPPAAVTVWGCGWGYLVKYLADDGYDVVGADASEYAIDKAKELFPDLAHRFYLRDITQNLHDVTQGLVITDDLLPCLTDEECEIALRHIRHTQAYHAVHFLTPNDYINHSQFDWDLNWKPAVIWRRLLWPDWVFDVAANRQV